MISKAKQLIYPNGIMRYANFNPLTSPCPFRLWELNPGFYEERGPGRTYLLFAGRAEKLFFSSLPISPMTRPPTLSSDPHLDSGSSSHLDSGSSSLRLAASSPLSVSTTSTGNCLNAQHLSRNNTQDRWSRRSTTTWATYMAPL